MNEGIESNVVDPASITVSRRRRWAKTDRLDGEILLRTLMAYTRGEPHVCAMVHVPSAEEEDQRRISRERKTLIGERVTHVNRIKGLLYSQGVSGYEPLHRDRRKHLDELNTGDGRDLPVHLKRQISRELDRLELLLEHIKSVETDRNKFLLSQVKQTKEPQLVCSWPSRGSAPRLRRVDGGSIPAFRQSAPDSLVCGPGPDTLAKRFDRQGARRVESRQS